MRKPEARGDRLEQRLGDGALARRRTAARPTSPRRDAERLDELAHVAERHRADLRDVLAAELHRERLGPEALALAGVARARHEEAPELVVGDAALAGVGVLVVLGRSARTSASEARRCSRRGTMPYVRALLAPSRFAPSSAAALRASRCRRGWPCAASSGSLPHGTSGLDAERLDRARELRRERDAARGAPTRAPPPRAACAARRRRTRSGSTTSRAPRPSHAGQAPCGPLNENMRGSIGGSEMPQSMQAKRSLIQNGSSSPGLRRGGAPRRA